MECEWCLSFMNEDHSAWDLRVTDEADSGWEFLAE